MARKRDDASRRVFALNKRARKQPGRVQIGLAAATFFMALAVALGGAFYLYQVNSIATKGFEMKQIENDILELKKESQGLKIKEVELKSMYNIEKSVRDLNLVNSSNITYVEINGPVAIR